MVDETPAAYADREPYTPPASVVWLLIGASFLLAAGFVAKGVLEAQSGPRRLAATLLDVKPHNKAPIDFELTTMGGEKVKLSNLRDKTVFLNFWATWCPPCVEEMPSLRRLQAKLKDDPNFVFLAVSTDEEWNVVRRFFAKDPAPFTVLLDPKGGLARRYGTTKFPETYVIHDGLLVGHIIGPRDWDDWFAEGWLRELLEEHAPSS